MKRLKWTIILILIWILYLGAGKQTEWYVEFYTYRATIHKCPRDKYNEYKELLGDTETKDERLDLMNYYTWEKDYQMMLNSLHKNDEDDPEIKLKKESKRKEFNGLWNIHYRNLTKNIINELNR